MNKGLFRLIFSTHLGMFVPASESTLAHSGKSSGGGARSRRRALAAALMASTATLALADQPAGLVAHESLGWTNANIANSSAAQMTIQQTAPKAILNWKQLNLGRGESLTFDQGGNRTWAALNRIHDANPSVISGNVKADGHLYFINTNGIIFGNGAQINTGSLTASTLDVTDELFDKGITSDPKKSVFNGTGGFVTVEQGAAITAATGGRVMLLAKDVTNSGVITTPDGQTILAAGEKVYLAEADDPAGLLVEVDAGGTATNLGEIIARRGNVTLVGLAVNQEGRISASTSVRANGSIHLLARDSVAKDSAGDARIVEQTVRNASGEAVKDENGKELKESVFQPQRYGKVTIGQGSSTVVSAEVNDKEEVLDEQRFTPSRVRIEGRSVEIDGLIQAKGGEVTADAKPNAAGAPAHTDPEFQDLKNRVYLGEHARIDVSGVDATAPMSRNQLEIQLYSEQLKDAPLLRGGELFGQKIYVDARNGTPLTDIAPFLKLKGRTVAEKLSEGGTVAFSASRLADQGEVIVRQGAVVDVSGGSVAYESGLIRESSLRYNGKMIPIAEATPDKIYQGTGDTYSVTDKKWGVTRTWTMAPAPQGSMQQGYTEGKDAGLFKVAAHNAALEGTFTANTRTGVFQREAPPDGGAFNLVLNGALRLVQDAWKLPLEFTAASALPGGQSGESQLDAGLLRAGFDKLELSGSRMTVDTAIRTGPNGSVKLTSSGGVAINADISVPGGGIDITGGEVRVADGVTLSTAGLWSNDMPGLVGALTAPKALDGGNVSISGKVNSANALTLGEGSLIDASAGAWLTPDGKLKGGKGGNIILDGLTGLDQGQVQSYGFSKGGELTLSTLQDVQAGGQQPAGGSALWLPESFFGQGGFSKYTINASGDSADMRIGDAGGDATLIHPQMQTLLARPGFGAMASGEPIHQAVAPALRPDHLRSPASVKFTAGDDLTVFADSTIRTDASMSADDKGSISLEAGGQMTINGSLIAPAGDISATITGATPNFDYDNTLSLFVGETARLLATGYYALAPSNDGLLDARVLNGGKITLDGGQRAAVVTRAGSLLDVSGVFGEADIAGADGYARETLHGAAGNITISSRNGLALDGDVRGVATGSGTGGTLALAINGATETPRNVSGHPDHPNGARVLTVTQDRINRADGLQAGGVLDGIVSPGADLLNPDDDVGTGAISAQQISEGGFDRVSLKASLTNPDDRIVLPSGLNLAVPDALTLEASMIEVSGNGKARVSAPNITLISNTGGSAPAAGDASLEVAADFIDLNGKLAVTGVKSTLLDSRTDIRGRANIPTMEGWLKTPGELVLKARQVYPVTNGQFAFEAAGANSRIEVQSSGATPGPVLSAGGKLTLKADEIEQAGALLAPLGEITLDAAGKLKLLPGSLTSVSAAGQLIPYGLTGLGGLNMYEPTTVLTPNTDSADGITSSYPDKRISLKSPDIDMQAGARVDLSGGGDTLAYEWIEGIGGSGDILGQTGVYAVIPTMRGEYAPFDYNYQNGSDLKPGDAVYLSGMPGLAAGTYTLLPGRYALLPGAFMVQTENMRLRQGQSVAQVDGSTLASGYRTSLADTSTNKDSQWDTFKVTDGSIFRTNYGTKDYKGPAEYLLTTGNRFFADLALSKGSDVPRLASDAGQLVLDAGSKLALGADLLTGKTEGARGALVDITADQISVVSAIGAEDGTLQLAADSLNALNAESLLLGGIRTQDADGNGMSIATNASAVTFANDAGHALKAMEFVAVAKDTLTVNSGAAIDTTENRQATGSTRLHASGEGALLAVSSLNDIEFDRSGVPASPAKGTLNIAADAKLAAGQSIVLDATKAATLEGDVNVAVKYAADGKTAINNGSVTLGADSILLGDSGSASGMKVDDAMLEKFGNLSKVSLNSYKNIDLYGPVEFGNDKLDITLNAGGIAGHLADGQVATLTANNFVLNNSAGAAYVPPADAAGVGSSLDINANSITFAGKAASKTTIGGFDTANLNAKGEVIFKGTGSTEIQAGQSNITSARTTAATGADYTIAATGAVNTARAIVSGILSEVSGLGAKLKMVAANIALGGNVELPSGQFTAQATTGNVTVLDGASIKAASVPVSFDKFTEHTPGGSVTLQADAGNVAVETGSTIDVSGSAGSDAGVLKLLATKGSTTVNGTLKGGAGDARQGGNFVLDTKTLPDFSGLNTALNSGGFTASRDMRIHSGDVTIAADDTVVAQQFVLSADAGKIDIAGTVNADGANGGNIEIYAKNDLTLKVGGKLLARGEGDSLARNDGKGAGGSVLLSSDSGAVKAEVFEADRVTRLANAAQIDVSGDKAGEIKGESGQVILRAGRTGADNSDFNPVTTTGSAAAYTASGVTLARGVAVAFKPHINSSGTAPTLNGKAIKKNGGDALAAAELKKDKIYLAVYDGTSFQLVSGDASGSLINGSGAVGAGVNVAADVPATVTGAGDLRLEAVRTYEKTTLDAKAQLQLATDTQAFYSRASTILTGYKPTQDGLTATLAPGVEVRSTSGDLTVASDWNLDTSSNGTLSMAGTGTLTLRARDRLVLNGSLSDDFNGALATSTFVPGNSWSYRLVSAADMGAVNPLVTNAAALDASLNAIKASPAAATGKIVSNVINLTSNVTGYSLDAAPTIAFSITTIPKDTATSVTLDVSTIGKKDLVKSNGSAINSDELISGVPYLAKYDFASGKYKLITISDVVLASNKLIRTGTGDIRIAAGGDLTMGNEASVIYTAGVAAADVPGFDAPALSAQSNKNGRTTASYLTGGGDIDILARGNITGKTFSGGNQQTVNQWLFRQGGGSDSKDVSWWVRPDLFKQGVAAFGGGNVTIQADGDITNFSASAPTTGRYDSFTVTKVINPESGALLSKTVDAGSGNSSVDGGGNLLVRAGGDIRSGIYHAGRGNVRLIAGGEIGAAPGTFGTTLALQDASAEVSAARGAFIETVFNPTLWMHTSNISPTSANGDSAFFMTYGDSSAFRIGSLTGDVGIGLEKSGNIKNATGLNNTSTSDAVLEVHPGTVEATAFSGNINLRKLVMAPSATGNLSLLAAGNISGEGYAAMSDADPALLPSVVNPLAGSSTLGTRMVNLRTDHAAAPLHINDDVPITIVARDGSISMVGDNVAKHQTTKGPGLTTPKAAYLHAGGDITLNAHIQHVKPGDLTVVDAGGDFKLKSGSKDTRLQVSGPGELLVKAGRNIDLADTTGILSLANTTNSALPDQGASLTLMAGLGEKGADVAGYVAAYIDPAGNGPAVLRGDSGKLAEYREQTAQAVTDYMRKLSGNSALSDTDALAQYLALDKDRQAVFAYRHFSSELLASGKGYVESGNHDRGDAAVAALFNTAGYDGDILMYKSQVRTSRDGSIDLLAPGGLINAGVSASTGDLGHDIGVVTEKGGAIRAFAETGFQVNQSKVITQYGSDVTVWANNGDIDAGRGSKTAVSVPKRVVTTDADGNTSVEFKGVAAGSGIRAQTYDPDGPDGAGAAPDLGSVALIAPRGVLNAGEAGIAAGNFLAVATQVIGADNIQVSGSSTGVPVADTGSLAGSLAGVSNLAPTGAGTEDVARQAAQSANNPLTQMGMPSFITVDVIGLGE